MTVSLIVLEPRTQELSRFIIPLATEDIFRRIWIPGAQQTKAFWLPMFETGVNVTANEFREISQELTLLRSWIEVQTMDVHEKDSVANRIHLLLAGLEQLKTETEGKVTVFIG